MRSRQTRPKRKRDYHSGPPSPLSISSESESEEYGSEPESESSEYDDRPRRKGKSGKGKREVELVEQISEDVLYAHRSVSFNAMFSAD